MAKSQGVDKESQTDVEFSSENNIQKEIFSPNKFDFATQTASFDENGSQKFRKTKTVQTQIEFTSTDSTFSESSNIGCENTQHGFSPYFFHIKPP